MAGLRGLGAGGGRRKRRLTAIYDRASATYDRAGPAIYAHFGRLLVEWIRLSPGQRVLDAATGRGACLLPASEVVGARGLAVGFDLSSAMLRANERERPGCQGLPEKGHPLPQAVMDAELPAFAAGSFDAVTCAFSLPLFPAPLDALRSLGQTLRPGGRLAISLWQEDFGYRAWLASWLRRVASSSPDPVSPADAAPCSTPELVLEGLRQVGLEPVKVAVEQATFHYADRAEWWSSLWSHGFREHVEHLNPFFLHQWKTKGWEAVRSLETSRGIRADLRAWLVVARKAPAGREDRRQSELTFHPRP